MLDSDAEIEESITTGSVVTIHAQLAADGSLTATEIDLAEDDANANDDDDDDDGASDNHNDDDGDHDDDDHDDDD